MNLTMFDWEGGSLSFEALTSEAPSYDADVPTAPVEGGYVALGPTVKNAALHLEALVSDISLAGPIPGNVEATKTKLIQLQRDGTPLHVSTDAGEWYMMVIKTISWVRTGAPTTQKISLTLSQIRIATVSVAAGLAAVSSGKRIKKKSTETEDKKHEAEKTHVNKPSLLRKGWDGGIDGVLGALKGG